MTNKWFRVSSNRSGSTRQLAGKAGFGDLCVGMERGVRDRGRGTQMLEDPGVNLQTCLYLLNYVCSANFKRKIHSVTSLFGTPNKTAVSIILSTSFISMKEGEITETSLCIMQNITSYILQNDHKVESTPL